MNRNKFYNYKLKARLKYLKVRNFCIKHQNFIIGATPVVMGIAAKTIKYITKQRQIKKTQDLKDRYIYDRSEGHYWELKRPLRADEWKYISRQRSAHGRKYVDILSELGVLK